MGVDASSYNNFGLFERWYFLTPHKRMRQEPLFLRSSYEPCYVCAKVVATTRRTLVTYQVSEYLIVTGRASQW